MRGSFSRVKGNNCSCEYCVIKIKYSSGFSPPNWIIGHLQVLAIVQSLISMEVIHTEQPAACWREAKEQRCLWAAPVPFNYICVKMDLASKVSFFVQSIEISFLLPRFIQLEMVFNASETKDALTSPILKPPIAAALKLWFTSYGSNLFSLLQYVVHYSDIYQKSCWMQTRIEEFFQSGKKIKSMFLSTHFSFNKMFWKERILFSVQEPNINSVPCNYIIQNSKV